MEARQASSASPPGPSDPFEAGQDCGEGLIYTNRSLRTPAKKALKQRCAKLGYSCPIHVYLGVVGTIEYNEDGSRTVLYDAWSGRPPRYHVTQDDSGAWTAEPEGLWALLTKQAIQLISAFAFLAWGLPGGVLWGLSRLLSPSRSR